MRTQSCRGVRCHIWGHIPVCGYARTQGKQMAPLSLCSPPTFSQSGVTITPGWLGGPGHNITDIDRYHLEQEMTYLFQQVEDVGNGL